VSEFTQSDEYYTMLQEELQERVSLQVTNTMKHFEQESGGLFESIYQQLSVTIASSTLAYLNLRLMEDKLKGTYDAS